MGKNTLGVPKGLGNPAPVVARPTDGKRIRVSAGTFGSRAPVKSKTVYAEKETGLTPSDLRRKAAWLESQKKSQAKSTRKPRAKKSPT